MILGFLHKTDIDHAEKLCIWLETKTKINMFPDPTALTTFQPLNNVNTIVLSTHEHVTEAQEAYIKGCLDTFNHFNTITEPAVPARGNYENTIYTYACRKHRTGFGNSNKTR